MSTYLSAPTMTTCLLPHLYLEQLESAILNAASYSSTSTSITSRESSQRLDAERCQSHDGLASACLELLRRRGWGVGGPSSTFAAVPTAQYDAITFYALTTLQRSPIIMLSSISSSSFLTNNSGGVVNHNNIFFTLRGQLRSLLITTLSHIPNLHSMPQFFATKTAVLLALLMREDYPKDWTHPVRDLMDILQVSPIAKNKMFDTSNTLDRMACMSMYLSFLDAINDEIVYPAADFMDDSNSSDMRSDKITHAIERKRREQVKDALRGFFIDENNDLSTNDNIHLSLESSIPFELSDAAQIVGGLLHFLEPITSTILSQNNTTHQCVDILAQLPLAVRATATLRRYLSWVDIRLAMSPNLVRMLLNGLGGSSSSCSPTPTSYNKDEISTSHDDEEPTATTQLTVQCAKCLQEIVERGMDEETKLALLSDISIFDALCQFSLIEVAGACSAVNRQIHGGRLNLRTDGVTQIEAVAAAAELINSAGLELIQGWEMDPTSVTANTQMRQCVELALACLAYDSIDVSGAVIDLFSRLLVSLEKKEAYWNNTFGYMLDGSSGGVVCDNIMSRILMILYVRMKYPTDFEFDYEDENESEEVVYRENLRKLYQRIVGLRPQVVLCFIGQCLSSLPETLSQSQTTEVECVLRLIYHYSEGRRPSPGTKTALTDGLFRQFITALHRSDVSAHPHREVLLLYYDICVRYSAILKESSELLTLLLNSLLSNRGLQHPHTRVRCRCCYLLLRLIKAIGVATMRPHIEAVVDGIQIILFPAMQKSEALSIPVEESQFLFEAMGILLGMSGLDTNIQVKCITAVLTPHIRSIEQCLAYPDMVQNVDTVGDHLSMSISAISQLSKGWQQSPPPEVQIVLMAAVDICHNVLESVPSCSLVRNRTAVFLQRMILCLGKEILPRLPNFFVLMLSYCTSEEDTLDISQLINQLCIKFNEEAAEYIDLALFPFLQKVLTVQDCGHNAVQDEDADVPHHLITERLSIRKQAFSTLQHIVVHNVSEVLYSQTNVGFIGDILQLMSDGAISVPDPVMNKTCIQFFGSLIKQWGCINDNRSVGPPIHMSNSFFDFVYDFFVPGMLSTIIYSNTFNPKDANHRRVLTEFGSALWSLKQSRRGNVEFQSRIFEYQVFGCDADEKRKCPDDIANACYDAKNGKDVETILINWKEAISATIL